MDREIEWTSCFYYNSYIENVGGYEFPRDELLCTQTFLNRGCMFASKWWSSHICINIIFPSCKIMSFTVIFPLILKYRLTQKLVWYVWTSQCFFITFDKYWVRCLSTLPKNADIASIASIDRKTVPAISRNYGLRYFSIIHLYLNTLLTL